MSTESKGINRQARLWLLTWTAGLVLGIFVLALRLFSGLRVRNQKRLLQKGPTLIVANHPAIWEAFILVGLFFPDYLFNPNLVPWSTPDKKNFSDKWHLAWARLRFITMARNNGQELLLGVNEIIETLQRGETVILFPEGGRTRSAHPGETHLFSSKGKRIRPFKPAALSRIVLAVPGLSIIPVWVSRDDDNRAEVNGLPDGWRPMGIFVGDPMLPGKTGAKTVVSQLERILLELADQVD